MIKIICVCGARPIFMKIAPIIKAFGESGEFQTLLVHTGQHYDEKMTDLFFDELEIPKPDINLEVGAGTRRADGRDHEAFRAGGAGTSARLGAGGRRREQHDRLRAGGGQAGRSADPC